MDGLIFLIGIVIFLSTLVSAGKKKTGEKKVPPYQQNMSGSPYKPMASDAIPDAKQAINDFQTLFAQRSDKAVKAAPRTDTHDIADKSLDKGSLYAEYMAEHPEQTNERGSLYDEYMAEHKAQEREGVSFVDDEGCIGGSVGHATEEGERRHRPRAMLRSVKSAPETMPVAIADASRMPRITVQEMQKAVITSEILSKPLALRHMQ